METLKKIVFTIIFVMIVFVSNGQSYNYPVKPGDADWKKITNSEEMYLVCQIPNELLKSMSTKDLVTTCLDYPLIHTLYAYNDQQQGFEALTKRFNGFEELLSRKDAGNALINVYSEKNFHNFNTKWSNVQKGNFTFEFAYIEILLAQKAIQSTLSVPEKKKLVSLCLKKYEAKQKKIEVFGTHGTFVTAWVMSRTMGDQEVNLKEQSDNLNIAKHAFIEQGLVLDLSVIYDVIERAKTYTR